MLLRTPPVGLTLRWVWAWMLLPLAILSLLFLTTLNAIFFEHDRLKISPWFTGGEYTAQVAHGAYTTRIHRPVFEYAFGLRPEGFIQVDWVPDNALPPTLYEQIDFDQDQRPDFEITWNFQSKALSLRPLNPHVLGLEKAFHPDGQRSVRVRLRRSPAPAHPPLARP